jgi:hypothetical protein
MALSRKTITVAVLLGVLIVAAVAWVLVSPRATYRRSVSAAAAPSDAPLPPSIDLVGKASIAMQPCNLPSPPAAPDGNSATLNQMLAARNEFQAYDAANNVYLSCIDAAIKRVGEDSAKVATKSDQDSLQLFGVRAHNTAIDQEQGYVDQFNVQLRAYKTKHPH